MNKAVLEELYENGGPELNYVCGLILQNSDEEIDRFTSALFEVFQFADIKPQRVGGRKGGGIKEALKAYIIICFLLITAFSARTCTEGKGFMWNSDDYKTCMVERNKDLKYESDLSESERALQLAKLAADTEAQRVRARRAEQALRDAEESGLLKKSDRERAEQLAKDTHLRELEELKMDILTRTQTVRLGEANTNDQVNWLGNKMAADNRKAFREAVVDYTEMLAGFLFTVAAIYGTIKLIRPDPELEKLKLLMRENGVLRNPRDPGAMTPLALPAPPMPPMPPMPPVPGPAPPVINHPTPDDLARMAATIVVPPVGPLPGYNALARHNNLYRIPENSFYPRPMTHVAEAYNASLANYRLYIRNPLQAVREPIGYTQLQTVQELHAAFANGEQVVILWTTNPNYAGGKSRRKHKKRSTRKH